MFDNRAKCQCRHEGQRSNQQDVPATSTTNSGVCVGNVPAPGGVYFFLASEPAIASVGIINQKREANIARPSVVL